MFRKRVAGYFKQCNDNFKTEKPLKDHLKMFPDESIRPKVHATTGKLDLGMGEIRKQQKSDKQTKPAKYNKQTKKQTTNKKKVHTTAGKLDLGMGEIRKQQKSDNIQTNKKNNKQITNKQQSTRYNRQIGSYKKTINKQAKSDIKRSHIFPTGKITMVG